MPYSAAPGADDTRMKYLELLARQYPNRRAVYSEIINLQAINNLPKGTEHFMSDLHGEYEAFLHIMNNCSGVIREKVRLLFALSDQERAEFCTLVYYPREKLARIRQEGRATELWYRSSLQMLIELAKFLSSKYTRSKVRKAMPVEFNYIIDELLHAQKDEDNNRHAYHARILDSILDTESADDFICALCALIKRLAVDHLHIVGDIFDRGAHADKIIDILMDYHSLDIEWGNHDILWMGAACGSPACIANVVRNSIRYNNFSTLEQGYGIPLRDLALFATRTYKEAEGEATPLEKAVDVLLFKLEGQAILRHPEYDMTDRLLLDKINPEKGVLRTKHGEFAMNSRDFPTYAADSPYRLNDEEAALVKDLVAAFTGSERLQRHVAFLYKYGSMYRCFNGNLLFHGCIPLDEAGNFEGVRIGAQRYHGKSYMDHADAMARRAWHQRDEDSLDFMWYLWCGKKSPLSGRVIKTFERAYCNDQTLWEEPKNPYYTHYIREQTCCMILHEFGLYDAGSHIINGHTPIHANRGESPVKASGRLVIIDGGFCRAYQRQTGIAGYTLIFNSHGMRIKSHRPFSSIDEVLEQNRDMESDSTQFEMEPQRLMVADTDAGAQITETIQDLTVLLQAYRSGMVREQKL